MLDVLERVPDGMLQRLRTVIEKEYEYFTLSGSDPAKEGGCCPSDDVAMANMLVKAGVLDAWEQPMPEGGCTLTVYAFRGEMDTTGPNPTYMLDLVFRQQVLTRLRAVAKSR